MQSRVGWILDSHLQEQRHSGFPDWLPQPVRQRRAGPRSQQTLRSAPDAPQWPAPNRRHRLLPGRPYPAQNTRKEGRPPGQEEGAEEKGKESRRSIRKTSERTDQNITGFLSKRHCVLYLFNVNSSVMDYIRYTSWNCDGICFWLVKHIWC